jgi:hypothetical protein
MDCASKPKFAASKSRFAANEETGAARRLYTLLKAEKSVKKIKSANWFYFHWTKVIHERTIK